MKKQIAIGVFAAASVALSPLAAAAGNPFQIGKLESGYQLAEADAKTKDGKCGEAKCGADKKADKQAEKKTDGKCGADKKKDAACGADKKKDASCGAKK